MAVVALVDYGLEDLALLETALGEAGADAFPSSDPDAITGADGIVLAGKAAYADAIGAIRELELEQHLKAAIVAKKPFLGVNVGMHLLFSVGREITPGQLGDHVVDGFGMRPGSCPPLPDVDAYGFDFALPHQGFSAVTKDARCRTELLDDVDDGAGFYFDHTFVSPTGPWVQAWSQYSTVFPAVVDFDRTCFGVQFQPELSGEAGMALLRRFVKICEESEERDLVFAQGPAL